MPIYVEDLFRCNCKKKKKTRKNILNTKSATLALRFWLISPFLKCFGDLTCNYMSRGGA